MRENVSLSHGDNDNDNDNDDADADDSALALPPDAAVNIPDIHLVREIIERPADLMLHSA